MGKPFTVVATLIISAALAGAATAAFAAGPDIMQEWATVKVPPPPPIKAVTLDPKTTALISMDFNGKTCTPNGRARCAAILPNAIKLLGESRAKGMLVVHTATSSMTDAEFVKDLAPKGDEKILRGRGDKFMGTDLDKMLKDRGVKTVLLIGTAGNSAVLYTALGASQRDYKAIVPIDVMPCDDAYQEQFTIWEIANGSQLKDGATLTRSDMIKF
jgi:nicotinamidase-related amidase